MALEKYEGLITVPTGGWAVSVEEFTPNAGPVTVTVPAGAYYLTSDGGAGAGLVSTLASLLTANGTLAGTYSASLSDTDAAATGKVTLSATGVTTFNLTWTSTTLRDTL